MPVLNRQLKIYSAFCHLPLRLVLVVPFVLQIFAAVGFTGWFSVQHGQKTIKELTRQLSSQASSRIANHLESQLALPHKINQINLEAVSLGLLNLPDFNRTGRFFSKQIQAFPVGYINFANPQGEFIGIERLDNGQLLINECSRRFSAGKLHVYTTNNQGDRLRQIAVKPYNPLIEAWYADAVKAKKPLWTKIYQWNDKPEVLSISSSYPVYNRDRQLIGVIGVDLILSQISHFLRSLEISPSSRTFILERDGLLVASSSKEPPFKMIRNKAYRLKVTESSDQLIQLTARYLVNQFGNLKQIQSHQNLDFTIAGKRQFIDVKPWRDRYGIDWLIVVVMPESDFMTQIHANASTTILLCLLSLAFAVLLGLMTSNWITRLIQKLIQASQAIAEGKLDQTIEIKGIDEIELLCQSFNQMAIQLKTLFTELEKRVEERTAELAVAKEAAEVANRVKSEFLASMTHELRTPLNAILGFTQIIQLDKSLTSEHQERLIIIIRNGQHLLSLINDILEISKMETNQVSSVINRFDETLEMRFATEAHYEEPLKEQNLKFYLSQMPLAWVAQLHQAAIRGYDQIIFKLIEEIPMDYTPLANSLKAWVREFRFDRVIDLIEKNIANS